MGYEFLSSIGESLNEPNKSKVIETFGIHCNMPGILFSGFSGIHQYPKKENELSIMLFYCGAIIEFTNAPVTGGGFLPSGGLDGSVSISELNKVELI